MSMLLRVLLLAQAAGIASALPVCAQGRLPDQQELAALRQLEGKLTGQIVWESNRTGNWQLYLMNADGTGARQLTRREGNSTDARFSADGQQILFTYSVPGKAPQLCIMRVDGTETQVLVENGSMGVWRNGGRTVQFLRKPVRGKHTWETWELDRETGMERLLFARPGVTYQADIWGGEGNDRGDRFVIWSPRPRGTWVMSADGKVQKHVHGGCEGQVATDQEYAYGEHETGNFVRFNLSDGEDMTTIRERGKGPWNHNYFPRVAADGKWLVYGACPPDQHNHDTSDYEVFIAPVADWKVSGPQVRLTFSGRTDRWPDLWVAPAGSSNPLPEGPYDVASNRATNPPPPPLAVFSFAKQDASPEFGGEWGLWPQKEGCQGTTTFVADGDAEGRKGGAMKIDYTIEAEPKSFSLWVTSGNGDVDLSAYDRFVIYAKGTVPSLTLVVKDRTATDPDAPNGIADLVVTGLTDEWQRFEAPFEQFKPRKARAQMDWSAINHMGVAMIAPQNAPTGTFWVDNLRALPAGSEANAIYPELGQSKDRLVCEALHEGKWDLFVMGADGSSPANLTNTAVPDELYPHASPDGRRICFVADEGDGDARTRSVNVMNADGTGRTKVAENARQPCWSPDGKTIAYLKGEFDRYTVQDFATKGIMFYDVATGRSAPHPNGTLEHLYNICWTPDGKWILATVHGGMGFSHALLAVEVNGTRVVDLKINGCRPDVSPDGKHVAWVESDERLAVADLDLSGDVPRATNHRAIVTSSKGVKSYHPDWSPDGRWIAFSRGPARKGLGPVDEMVGVAAKGWNLCVVDPARPDDWVAITSDGASYKEPDWLPAEAE